MDRKDVRAATYFGSLMGDFTLLYLAALAVGGACFPTIQLLLAFLQKALINGLQMGQREVIGAALKLSGAIVLIVFVIFSALPRSARRLLTYPRIPSLIPGTVEDNIKLGQPDASRQEVELACTAAAIHATIPEGYATDVDAVGQGFSRGEVKRIMLARAFLRGAPLLLLDEPTSGLYLANEAAISRQFDELLKRRAILMVTHRPSLLARADVVHVMERGEVIESRAHRDLARTSRRYALLGFA